MESYDMKSLFDLFNDELMSFPNYKAAKYKSIEDFITSDSNSAEFINHLCFDDTDIYQLNNASISQGRARHSVITFFLGLVLGRFCKLFGNLSSVFNDYDPEYLKKINEPYINYWLWLLTSTNHDYGYYSDYLKKALQLSELKCKNKLFDDSSIFDKNMEPYSPLMDYEKKYPRVLKNSYNQIEKYYDYSIFFHKDDTEEKVDHGILGACLIYDRSVSRIKQMLFSDKTPTSSMSDMNRPYSIKDILFYKTACLTIAQHNIFKSSEKTDSIYEEKGLDHLLSYSNYFIDIDTPMLALLSLVDTIECVKVLSKREMNKNIANLDEKQNNQSVHTLTVLKNISMVVNEEEIIIDYSKLNNFINERQNRNLLQEEFKNYLVRNIGGLNNWTGFNTIEIDAFVYKIKRNS